MWRRAWVDGVDQYEGRWWEAYRLVQNHGRGLLMQGGCDWTDYTVSSTITLHMAEAAGLAARVQGMRRYYALLLRRATAEAQLIRALDGDTVLAETAFAWEFGATHDFALTVKGTADRRRHRRQTPSLRCATTPSPAAASPWSSKKAAS